VFGVHKVTSGGSKQPAGPTTVLFSVQASTRVALESALLAADPQTRHGVEIFLPRRVIIPVCGFGSQQLTNVLALPDGARLSRTAVTDLLGGVRITGSWTLTSTQLTRLVDELGGITTDVDINVEQPQPDGTRLLLVQKGSNRHLTGSQAVTYATYIGRNEDASVNLVRLQNVLTGLLAALPRTPAAVATKLSSLGPGATSTLGASKLASLLLRLARDDRANRVVPTELPVVSIDAGGTTAYRVDPVATRQFVEGNLAAAVPASARVRRKAVVVQNGIGTPGLVPSACKRLVAGGLQVVASGNATPFTTAPSKILIFSHSVGAAELGDRVARLLHLPESDVAVSAAQPTGTDVLVILGKDYRP
jgi:anionic cell wall polymer biosynthesis LytR-Cps2A-Psr (LCP) family protein